MGTETTINNADFSFLCLSTMSRCNALFATSILDGIILSHVSTVRSFSRKSSGLCFHNYSRTGMLKCLQMCQWITPHTLSCLSVYSCSDMSFLHPERRWLVLSISSRQKPAFVRLTQSCHFLQSMGVMSLVLGIDPCSLAQLI